MSLCNIWLRKIQVLFEQSRDKNRFTNIVNMDLELETTYTP